MDKKKDILPLVSIGVPVYNVELYIEKCLISIFDQTYQNLEIIIVDDCGNDNTMNIISNLQNSHPKGKLIRVIKHPSNRGIGEARNTIIDSAKGKYLYFLDADDYIEPDTISLMTNEAEAHQTDAVLASSRTINDSPNVISPVYVYKQYQLLTDKDAFQNMVCADIGWNVCVCVWNILFLVDFLRLNHLRFSVRVGEDCLFLSDYYSEIKRAVTMPNITYNYVIRKGSLMGHSVRQVIPSWEIRERFKADSLMTLRSKKLNNRSFYDVHCSKVMRYKFLATCAILKHYNNFDERISYKEIGADLRHPATLLEILRFKRYRLFNLLFYCLGVLPYPISVRLAYLIGKKKHWI